MPESTKRQGSGEHSLRERMFREAARLFRENGYDGTSIRSLGEAVGIQSASLYHYVDGKEDILTALAVGALEEAITGLATIADDEDLDVSALFEEFVKGHVTGMLRDPDRHAVMLTEFHKLSEPNLRKVLSLRDEYDALVQRIVDRARDEGVLSSDVDPKLQRLMILNSLNWSIFWFRSGGRFSIEDVAAASHQFVLNGFGRPQGTPR